MTKRLICCHEVIELGAEKSSKEEMSFKKMLAFFVMFYLSAVVMGFLAALYGITYENIWEKVGKLLIMTTSVATVKQMIEETTLMNKSLIEMRKQRLNIEEYKNYLLEYLRYLVLRLEGNATSGYQHVEEPYSYIWKRYKNRVSTPSLSPAEEGFMRRVSKFIEKFLKVHGLEPQEIKKYNDLIANYARGKDSQLLETIRERSKELLEITKPIFQMVEEMSGKELEEEILKILEF